MTRIQYGVPEMLHDDLSLSEARCVALAAQGFDRPRPRCPVTVQHLRRTIRQLGLVQIDYVNVLVAAHYLIPFSRLGPYDRSRFDDIYRIEIFVPKEKRKWGYYVLPFLLGDRLVARVDLKADRAECRLLVLAAHLEPHTNPGQVADRLAGELRTMANWLGLDSVAVQARDRFARQLAASVRAD